MTPKDMLYRILGFFLTSWHCEYVFELQFNIFILVS